MKVETLFDVFCECAELNPEPVQGKTYNYWFNSITNCIFWLPSHLYLWFHCIFQKKKKKADIIGCLVLIRWMFVEEVINVFI